MLVKPIIVLIVFLASLIVFGDRLYRRFEHMRLGQPTGPFARWGDRIKAVVVFVLAQWRLFRFPTPGLAHFFIFWGFLLLFPTIAQAIAEGISPRFLLPILSTFLP